MSEKKYTVELNAAQLCFFRNIMSLYWRKEDRKGHVKRFLESLPSFLKYQIEACIDRDDFCEYFLFDKLEEICKDNGHHNGLPSIPTPKRIQLLGETIKYVDGKVKIGCQDFTIEELKKLYHTYFSDDNVKSIHYIDRTINRSDAQELMAWVENLTD